MAMEELLEKIARDAEEEAGKIKAEASAKAEEIMREAEKRAVVLYERMVKEGRREADEQVRKEETLALLDSRRQILEEKRAALKQAFDNAYDQLINLPDGDYCALIKGMLLRSVDSGDEEIIIAKKDEERITEKFLEEVNRALQAGGRKGELRLSSERGNMEAGFILRSGRKETNCSFLSLFEEKKAELEIEVARLLLTKLSPTR